MTQQSRRKTKRRLMNVFDAYRRAENVDVNGFYDNGRMFDGQTNDGFKSRR